MKKILLLTIALFTLSGVWAADGNLALNKTATASSGNAAAAVDGNTGTRWESAQTDEEWWMVDLGEASEFNTIQILWEGAYSKSFTITVSTDGETFTQIVSVENQSLSGFPHQQKLKFDAVTARYVKFNVIARATQWGNSFYEFGVYNVEAQVLNSLAVPNPDKADATKTIVKVGGNITVTAKDQNGLDIDEGIDYTATNGTITSAGVFTPTAKGVCTITATQGLVSKTVTVYAYEGDDLLLGKIGFTNPEATDVEKFNNGNWGDRGGLGQPADNHTWLYYDLDAYYTIDLVDLKQEQACGKNYTIQFSPDGISWVNAYTVENEKGMAGDVRHYFYGSLQNTNVRFVRFDCTMPATEYGVSIYEIAAYGVKTGDIEDSEAPTAFSASLQSVDFTSATLSLSATDNISAIKYVISRADAEDVEVAGPSGETITVRIKGLTPATAYSFSIVAKDNNDNATDPLVVNATTDAWVAAPTPTAPEDNVYALLSDAYTDTHNFSYQVWWAGQAKQEEIEPKTGDKVWHIWDFVFIGSQHDKVDASEFVKLHMDIMPIGADLTLAITPVNADENANLYVNTQEMTANQWNSVDINISEFIAAGLTMKNAFQVKITGKDGVNGTGQEFYLDNIYYLKEDTPVQPLYVIGDGTTKGWDRTAMDQMTYNSSTQTYTYEYTPTAAENWFAIADYQQSAEEAAADPSWVNFRTHRYYISEGTDFVPELGTEYSMITGDGSIVLPKGTYTISIKDMKITVTGTIDQRTVTFVNDENWDNVYVHAWNGEGDITSWPGEKLTNNGDNTYTWNTTSEPTGLLFHNNAGTQTEDLVFTDGATYNAYSETKNTVTFKNTVGWENVYAYTFDAKPLGDWPGTPMTVEGGVYTVSFFAKNAPEYIIFNDGLGKEQTPDLNFVNGKEYDYNPATAGFYVVGNMTDWAMNSDYKMALNAASAEEEYMLPSIDLTTASAFKVARSVDGVELDTWYPEGGGNAYGENGEIAEDGNYSIYFRPSEMLGWFADHIYVDKVTSLVDRGVDAETGAHVIVGPWDGVDFATLDESLQANTYDLTNIASTFDGGPINTTKKNALFIARDDQNIGKNKVVDNGDGTYTGTNIEILDYNEYGGQNTEMNTQISPIIGYINYHRTLPSAGIYLTQVVPFSVDVPGDVTAYEATASKDESGEITITFSEVTTLQPGVPYLLNATTGGVHFLNVTSLDFSVEGNAPLTGGAFKGTYAPITSVPANVYVVAKGSSNAEFRPAAVGSYIPAFRAYLQFDDAPAKINVMFDDATGIHAATAEQLEGIFNIYSIDGKLVRQNGDKMGLNKGVYIINGKKVVVK